MKSIRAKFHCYTKDESVQGEGPFWFVRLQPVTPMDGGPEENKIFGQYTPSGELTMGLYSKGAADQLVPGRDYYLDITEAQG